MSREVILSACLGLGDATRPTGLVCDPETGRYELAEAVNVDVTAGRMETQAVLQTADGRQDRPGG